MERDSNRFRILFAGNIGEAQDFPSILQAAKILKQNDSAIIFYVVGDGRMSDWVQNEVNKMELQEYVVLLGRFPLEEMPAFYASADVLLATLKDSPVFAKTIPCKVQSYMAAGKPVLTMISGEGSRIVEEAECGYIAPAGDYKKLADNILRMAELSRDDLEKMGHRAKIYTEQEFDREKLIDHLEILFSDLMGQKQ